MQRKRLIHKRELYRIDALDKEDDMIIKLVIERKGIQELDFCFNMACSSNIHIVKVALKYNPTNLRSRIKSAQFVNRQDIIKVIRDEIVRITREKIRDRS